MSKTDEIRKEAKLLEDKIAELINVFVTEDGICGVDVETETRHIVTPKGEIMCTGAKVNVTISI